MRLHLQGMGVLGCYLALRLERDRLDFTWSDSGEPINAWRACTGAIFPTGHAEDQRALDVWRGHLSDPVFADQMEEATYVFCTKNPPHEARYTHLPLAGDVKLASVNSLHLNAQRWVPAVRERFNSARVASPAGAVLEVRAHGFTSRLVRYMWGWTLPVKVRCSQELSLRPALYFRRGRFKMAYAYPVPGSDTWYAGSSLISQRVPRQLTIASKYTRWREDFFDLGGGFVEAVEVAGPPIEGWRPVGAREDTSWVKRLDDGRLAVKPLWHSGVRHAPLVYEALTNYL